MILKIERFRKFYQGRLALSIDNLEVPSGIHWVQGNNGSGKTTFFRAIAGIIPCEGIVILDDTFQLHRHPVAYRLRVNYAEAEPNYPGFLSGHDLIGFVGKAKQAKESQIEELVASFEIQDFYRNPMGTYSSGMLKKISLVLAFLGTPSLILLDEPLITIDRNALAQVFALIRRYRQQGCSFLISSHQAVESGELPIDRTYIVQNQKVTGL